MKINMQNIFEKSYQSSPKKFNLGLKLSIESGYVVKNPKAKQTFGYTSIIDDDYYVSACFSVNRLSLT